MTLWLDAHLSPKIVPWLQNQFSLDAFHVRDLNLREAEDPDIFNEARKADAVVMTKDEDFPILLERLGPPPQVIWLTCGNTSNEHLMDILRAVLPTALDLLQNGESLVEITGQF